MIAATGGLLALASGPLDDLWHRLYGLDVTILSPPHVLLVTGVAIAAYGALAGFTARVVARRPRPWRQPVAGRPCRTPAPGCGVRRASSPPGACSWPCWSAVLGEYDFDVARTPVWLHPVLLAGLSALALSLTARAGGRVGGATLAATAYTLFRLLAQLELLVLTGASAPDSPPAAGGPGAGPGPLGPEPAHAPPPLGGGPPAGALYGCRPAAHSVALHHRGRGGDRGPPRCSSEASVPTLAAGAAGALAGWALGALLRPLPAPATAPRACPAAPSARPAG